MKRLLVDLPWLCAVVFGGGVLSLGLGGFFADVTFGRPSSTEALILVFVPIYAVVFAAGGLVVGWGVRAVLRPGRMVGKRSSSYKAAVSAGLLIFILVVAAVGVVAVWLGERQARPRVLSSTPAVAREVVGVRSCLGARPGELIWPSHESPPSVAARTDVPSVSVSGVSVSFAYKGLQSPSLAFRALDYLTSVYVLPLSGDADRRSFVAVINGRATGRRSVVLFFSSALRVLHAELVETWWHLDAVPVFAEAAGPAEAAMVGCADDRAIRFRLTRQPNPTPNLTKREGP